MTYLVEILLPAAHPGSSQSPEAELGRIRDILTERFGGLTAFTRGPAEGIWNDPDRDTVEHDDIVVVEVMAEELDVDWWSAFRAELEHRLHQKEIVIRAQQVRRL